MSDALIAIISVASAFVYFGGVGVAAVVKYDWTTAEDWDHPMPMFWPFMLPMWLGAAISGAIVKWLEARRTRQHLPKAQVRK